MTIETQTIEGLKALYDAWMDAEGSAARVTAVIPLERAAIDALPTLFANAERQAEMIAALTGQAKNAEIEMERLRGEVERLRALVHVPGLWRCAKCNFVLVQKNLYAASGTVGPRDEPGDRCPNCDVPLWRVTERENGDEMGRRGEEQLNRAVKAEAAAERWKSIATNEYAESEERREWIEGHVCAALPAPAQAEPVAWERERKMHVVNLEQCSIFVDSDPIKRAMTDAAAFLRAAPPPQVGEG